MEPITKETFEIIYKNLEQKAGSNKQVSLEDIKKEFDKYKFTLQIKEYFLTARFIIAIILLLIITMVGSIAYWKNGIAAFFIHHKLVFCFFSSLCGFVSLILNLNNIFYLSGNKAELNSKLKFWFAFLVVYIPFIFSISSLVYAILKTQIPNNDNPLFYLYAFPICFISNYFIDDLKTLLGFIKK